MKKRGKTKRVKRRSKSGGYSYRKTKRHTRRRLIRK